MFSGLSSVVRKCVHKASGQEYAVKIVDKLGDHGGCDIGEVTKNEADILKILSGHKNISKLRLSTIIIQFIIWTRSLRSGCIRVYTGCIKKFTVGKYIP